MEMSAKQRWVSVAFNEQQKMVGGIAVTKSGTRLIFKLHLL